MVEAAIERALRRMGVETLDMLQVHWWDYDDDRYLDALGELARLRDEGRIRHLGLTNFDTEHIPAESSTPVSRLSPNQVQYSLI